MLLYPVSWQIYVESANPGMVLVENSTLNELGTLDDGLVEARENTFQFAYAAAFRTNSRLRIEDAVINSQNVLAQRNGMLEVADSSIWGSRVEARDQGRVRLRNVAIEANVCHPGCLPACIPQQGGNQCNGFNNADEVSFNASDQGAILMANLAPITAPVVAGTTLAVIGDALVESADPALAGYVSRVSWGADGAAFTPLTGDVPGTWRNAQLATLDTTGVSPGDYWLRLELDAPGEPLLVAERPFRVEAP